jgi:hypothetical protein
MQDYDYRTHDVDVNRNVPVSAASSSANKKTGGQEEQTKPKDKGIKSVRASGKGPVTRKRGSTNDITATAPKKEKDR